MAYNSTAWTTDGNTNTTGGYSLYAYFGIGNGISANWAANTHIALPFMGYPQSSALADNPSFGTSTDPATTLTTADGANTDASLFVACMWYVPDNIVIDAVYSLEGADNATGSATRMHLMSYTFTSASTSCLTEGVVVASNSDVTNAGSEQAYLSEWTIDSNYSSVAAGKVILATFRCDDNTSDFSVNTVVKYHLS
jgi:hypothetical protein